MKQEARYRLYIGDQPHGPLMSGWDAARAITQAVTAGRTVVVYHLPEKAEPVEYRLTTFGPGHDPAPSYAETLAALGEALERHGG